LNFRRALSLRRLLRQKYTDVLKLQILSFKNWMFFQK